MNIVFIIENNVYEAFVIFFCTHAIHCLYNYIYDYALKTNISYVYNIEKKNKTPLSIICFDCFAHPEHQLTVHYTRVRRNCILKEKELSGEIKFKI